MLKTPPDCVNVPWETLNSPEFRLIVPLWRVYDDPFASAFSPIWNQPPAEPDDQTLLRFKTESPD
ncbi:MAG: hypothetical protein K6C40_00250 [Thermoguttaceae bacterium]|nr:hypothetical protein [Thermoguttaceae bacterium]